MNGGPGNLLVGETGTKMEASIIGFPFMLASRSLLLSTLSHIKLQPLAISLSGVLNHCSPCKIPLSLESSELRAAVMAALGFWWGFYYMSQSDGDYEGRPRSRVVKTDPVVPEHKKRSQTGT